jgi:hypothetical protein
MKKRLDESMSQVKTLFGIVEEKSRTGDRPTRGGGWRHPGTGITAPRAAGRDRSSLPQHECAQKCRNALK